MADFEFRVTGGPYEGRYSVDLVDLSAVDSRDFRQAIGTPLSEVVAAGGGDLDVLAALVWLTRRRGNRGLPFAAVADHLTYGNVEQVDADDSVESPDPTTPEGG